MPVRYTCSSTGREGTSWQKSCFIYSLAGGTTTGLATGGSRSSRGQCAHNGSSGQRRRCCRNEALNCVSEPSQIVRDACEGLQQDLHAAQVGIDAPNTPPDRTQFPLQHVEPGSLEFQEWLVLPRCDLGRLVSPVDLSAAGSSVSAPFTTGPTPCSHVLGPASGSSASGAA
ncbi:hypothetical protein SKAU_G00274840 [Synaphobranchus kaupii]|uniref:Uncharacterized protein n=1 Tax=Synaphobranchus kaupii TaxID=118154 RepID=A0A9Q1F113_SYNKA|nr:hypothetical protein SKAU_G00274840 [Synaphobranchus kaupii]